jgi:hypothetical protein
MSGNELIKELEKQEFWKPLSFALKVLSKHVINEKEKRELNTKKKASREKLAWILILVSIIVLLYLISKRQNDIFYMSSVTLLCFFAAYIATFLFKDKPKDTYDEIRAEIIDTIKTPPCTHSDHCECREQYISFMYENKIDLTRK